MTPLHILVVDDDMICRQGMKEYLEQQGYEVSLADGCRAAIRVLRDARPIDVMILDYLLADGTASDILRAVAEDHLQTPLTIMASTIISKAEPAWEAICQRLPPEAQALIQGCVTKPYSPQVMEEAVRRVLESPPPWAAHRPPQHTEE